MYIFNYYKLMISMLFKVFNNQTPLNEFLTY